MLQFSGDTEYISRLSHECEIVRKRLLPRERVLGFACHWKGDNEVATIQLATPCTVFIFHVSVYADRLDLSDDEDDNTDNPLATHTTSQQKQQQDAQKQQQKLFEHKQKTLPPFCGQAMFQTYCNPSQTQLLSHELRFLLESSSYIKVGVNIAADFMKLADDLDIQYDAGSLIDVGALYNQKLGQFAHWNLCTLCGELLGGEIDRNGDIAKSEWSHYPLDEEQMQYAQESAYFALRLLFAIHALPSSAINDDDKSSNSGSNSSDGYYGDCVRDAEDTYDDACDSAIEFKTSLDVNHVIGLNLDQVMVDDEDKDEDHEHSDVRELMGIISGSVGLLKEEEKERKECATKEKDQEEGNDDYFANIVCDDSPLFEFLSPIRQSRSTERPSSSVKVLTQHDQDRTRLMTPTLAVHTHIETQPQSEESHMQSRHNSIHLAVNGIIDAFLVEQQQTVDGDSNDVRTYRDVMQTQTSFLCKLRCHEMKCYFQMDSVLNCWMWSWSEFVFPSRKLNDTQRQYVVPGTGSVQRCKLSIKKKEVYQCFDEFAMSFDDIIKFRGYALSHKQIEMILSDVINLGFHYNWKLLHNAVFRASQCFAGLKATGVDVFGLNQRDAGENLFCRDFVILQMKVIELTQKQLNEIFKSSPGLKQKLMQCYDNEGMNPKELHRKLRAKANATAYDLASIVPTQYEEKLKKVRQIYDDIWMMMKLKPILGELTEYFEKEEQHVHKYMGLKVVDTAYMRLDQALVRYSLVRMIVFHIKRVVWMKHFIFH